MTHENATIIRRFVDRGKSTRQHSMSGKTLLSKFHCLGKVLDLTV
jgi:hypothetical protein